MRKLYNENTANHPRLKTDTFFADYGNSYEFKGFVDDAIKYIEDFQLLDDEHWFRFVNQFRHDADHDAGWRGEYWGKMMRGACFTYSYTKNPKLYDTLQKTVLDMLDSADSLGRISSYDVSHEFDGWDIWSRKYVLLGLQYFLEICTDKDLEKRIVDSMKGQVDYIISKIGDGEDKKQITKATRHWHGLNSSSLLEPIVRLYSLTNEQKYLDFAKYIVDCGGTDIENFFDLAYENKLAQFEFPVTKAYEMTSCFEGLLEYYRIVGNERYKTAVINFADKILENDFTIIGSSGCTHELFDHSTVRQADTTNRSIMQETCVTVTLMKFFYQLALLTGGSKYSDAFEISLYNAYLGAININKVIEPTIKQRYADLAIEPLPFDSYSPLFAGTRGRGVGGFQIMNDNHYYGCCACIGSAGAGLVSKMTILTTENGVALNMFINGTVNTKTPLGNELKITTETLYPICGKVKVKIDLELPETFEILVRNPKWSKTTEIAVNGEKATVCDGYVVLKNKWQSGDVLEIDLDMRTRAIKTMEKDGKTFMDDDLWGSGTKIFATETAKITPGLMALLRGPMVLAAENRLGYSVDEPQKIAEANGFVETEIPDGKKSPYPCLLEVTVPLIDGGKLHLTDYASAGKLWTLDSKMAAWMKTE